MQNLKPGDKIAYSVQFLKSIGESHGEMACARGTIESIQPVGDRLKLAVIAWDGCDMPRKVNVVNLAKVGLNRYFSNID